MIHCNDSDYLKRNCYFIHSTIPSSAGVGKLDQNCNRPIMKITFNSVIGLFAKVLVAGGYRGGFREKLREASPMCDKASASQL